MARILDWLEDCIDENPGLEAIFFVRNILFLDILWSFAMVVLLMWLGLVPADSNWSGKFSLLDPINWLILAGAIPLLEEIIFRAFPLYIAMILGGIKYAVYTAILSSALFGYLHGGFTHILTQGAGGIMLSIVFLRCGGAKLRPLSGLKYSWLLHSAFNGTLFALLLLFGQKTL